MAADDGERLPNQIRTHSRSALPYDPSLAAFAARHAGQIDEALLAAPNLAGVAALLYERSREKRLVFEPDHISFVSLLDPCP